ncbi:hypothetical protein BGW37DRAFT_488483 [Umbelopsis sp. PMI_123]|nr:hypothetical protein BGW37DRAFT_488483 [Umbelopsis sp. PMI_123]
MSSEVAECSICMEPLSGLPLAALPCKHVYHNDCITTWIRSSAASVPKCPVCRSKTKRNQVIGPLYFTIPASEPRTNVQSTTTTIGSTEDVVDLSYATDLKTNFEKAYKSLEEKTTLLEKAQQQLERFKVQAIQQQSENIRLQENLSRSQLQLRYVKALRGVQELDTALQSPSAQARMRQWKELPRDQLALILGTLYEKTSMVENERALWQRKDRMQQEELNILRISLEKSEQKRKKMVLKKQEHEKEIERLSNLSQNGGVANAYPPQVGSSSATKRRIASDDETDSNATDDEVPTPVIKKSKPIPIELSSDSDTDAEDHVPIVARSKPIHPKRLELLGIPPPHEPTAGQ